MLSEAALKNFAEIYKREFGTDLSPTEALEAANNLLNLYRSVYSTD